MLRLRDGWMILAAVVCAALTAACAGSADSAPAASVERQSADSRPSGAAIQHESYPTDVRLVAGRKPRKTPTRTQTPLPATATRTTAPNPTATRTAAPAASPTATPVRTNTPRPNTSTPMPTPTLPSGGGSVPRVGGCAMFPSDNPWNQAISAMPIDPNSATYIASINATGGNGFLHADFGGGGAYGIPYIVVPAAEPFLPINFTAYGDESDPGPYPVPLNAPIEGGGTGDAHVLAVQQGACKLYEMFNAHPSGGGWNADSGAVFDLNSNALRPDSWTSADAAGLPILAGLVRYDEVAAGAINHALRFTVGSVQRAWVHPATHYGTSTDPSRPPYGTRLRLKASFDISGYDGQSRVVLEALKTYGMIVADQGGSWFITGASDPRWDDDDLNQLKTVPGTAFEVVQLGPIFRP